MAAEIVYEGPNGLRRYEGDYYTEEADGTPAGFISLYDDDSDKRGHELRIPLHRVYSISVPEPKGTDLPSLEGQHID